jgi:hypothetical protein
MERVVTYTSDRISVTVAVEHRRIGAASAIHVIVAGSCGQAIVVVSAAQDIVRPSTVTAGIVVHVVKRAVV